MFAVVVSLTLEPETFDQFIPLMKRNAEASLSEEIGCLQFDIATDPSRRDDVFLYELYKNRDAFDHHLASEHFKQFDEATANMIANKTVKTYSEVSQ